ncbi:MAG TPA: tetratricopeptide repeat protein, partial [Candidatus Sulfotelmatobacter sp.]
MKNDIANLLLISLALSVISAGQQPDVVTSPVASKPAATADFTQARKLMQEGKLDDAIAQLHAVEAQDPAAKGLPLELGTAYYRKNDFPQAIEYLRKANAADPANDEAVQMLGLAYFRGGHPADAIPLLEKVQGWYPRANV